MITITADAATRATLNQLDQLTEIRDDQGNVLGFYAPAERFDELLYLDAASHFDPKEMERRIASGEKGVTTKELLDRLKSMGTL
jgi:hypothetical protein